jgi:hypothetical protein
VVSLDKRKIAYNQRGVRLFSGDYDQIQYAGENLFLVVKKEKRGLVNSEAKIVLPLEYDAIGAVAGHVALILKSMKFGAYHTLTRKLIKPQFEKNLVVYNARLLIAYQKGAYGFVDWDVKPQTKFEFDEIKYWNDSTCLVRKNFNWMVYDLIAKKSIEGSIKKLDYILDGEDEKLAIVKQENNYGVISSTRGFVIPPTFNNVINIGNLDEPLYFTEKHVEEASIYVVIYYDKTGKMIYRQVYEEQDYENILCSDN